MKAPSRLKPADFERTRYFLAVDAGTTMQDVTGTEIWAHVHKALKPMDVVEVVAVDGSIDVDIRLVAKTPAKLTWRVIREASGTAQPIKVEKDAPFKALHKGRGVYAVQAKSDGSIIADGLTKDQADAEVARMSQERQAA